uniref:Uncharacterized protein n=1 Tax=Anguilla anguilla TaxID=7936 RepID=A0A0E9PQI2_ANGAN
MCVWIVRRPHELPRAFFYQSPSMRSLIQ